MKSKGFFFMKLLFSHHIIALHCNLPHVFILDHVSMFHF